MGGSSHGGIEARDRGRGSVQYLLTHIGAIIRTRRHDRGWSIQELARCAGLSAAMVSLVERGLAAPSLASLDALAECLEIELVELFGISRHEPSADGHASAMNHDGTITATTIAATTIADATNSDGTLPSGQTAADRTPDISPAT